MSRTRTESPAPLRTDDERQEAIVAEIDTETYSGEFYCVKCKAKREASGYVVVNDKGTRMAKATCPVCSTNLNRILGKA
jgi:Domain of unknown function (DUF5679)